MHCTLGKDRTGVLIAVLLAAIGVRDDDIERTYAQSSALLGDGFIDELAAVLGPELTAGSARSEAALEAILASPAAYIQDILAHIRYDHGTVAAYLLANGLEPEELERVRNKLVG
ncbi:tyrosine-protein phosphatase [Nocardia stercoris]|uniref:tyrosine-protein phosphatase n=1 Tax=Nocardia stercoris TaxID=2483361 RepID=UPI00131A0AB0|nr:tyrosine-protein phosphatase [Nocardia stercoris]